MSSVWIGIAFSPCLFSSAILWISESLISFLLIQSSLTSIVGIWFIVARTLSVLTLSPQGNAVINSSASISLIVYSFHLRFALRHIRKGHPCVHLPHLFVLVCVFRFCLCSCRNVCQLRNHAFHNQRTSLPIPPSSLRSWDSS